MSLTRVTVKWTNGKTEIVDKQTGIVDTNPIVYHGNEELPITDDENAKPIARGLAEFEEYIKKNEQAKNKKVNIS